MNFKTTYILFGILLTLVIVFNLSWLYSTKPGEELYVMSDLRRENVKAKDINAIEIERTRPTAEKIAFERNPETKQWKMTQPYAAPVENDSTVEQIINQVLDARREEKPDTTGGLEQHGLKTPGAVVTLATGDGKQWKLNLGGETIGSAASKLVYVNTASQPKDVLAVRRGDIDSVFKTAKDFRTKDLVAPSALNITSVDLQDAKNEMKLSKKGDFQWVYDKPAYGDAEYQGEGGPVGKISGVHQLLETLEQLKVAYNPENKTDDFVAEGVKDLAHYGLEAGKPEFLRIGVTRNPGGSLGGESGGKPITDALLIGKVVPDDKEKRYARLQSDNNVVKLPIKSVEPIAKVLDNPSSLRNRDLVQLDNAKVDAINIKQPDGNVIKLRKPAGSSAWKLFDAADKGRDTDLAQIMLLLNGMTVKHQVKDFPDPAKEKDYGFTERSPELSVWVGGLAKKDDKESKKDEKEPKADDKEPKLTEATPTVKLIFGEVKDGNVYVKRIAGKDTSILTIPDTLLSRVKESKLAFLDKKLPNFKDDADVTRIVLVRTKDKEKETYELVKEKDEKGPGAWKIKQPKNLDGRTADPERVRGIIDDLAFLRAERLVAEKGNPKELDAWGLEKPQVQVTVTVRKEKKKEEKKDEKDDKKDDKKEVKKEEFETEEWVYLFGAETEKKDGIYAKQGQRDMVFLVRPEVLKPLTGDVADLQVVNFVPAKVKRIKLSGWKPVAKRTLTLDVERDDKEKTWVVKNKQALEDFALNTGLVDALVTQLSNLKAEKFIAFKLAGPPPKEYGLDADSRNLEIEMYLEGGDEKTPLKLTIGKLQEKEKGYAATSSALPGDIFLLPQERFQKLVEGEVKYFGK